MRGLSAFALVAMFSACATSPARPSRTAPQRTLSPKPPEAAAAPLDAGLEAPGGGGAESSANPARARDIGNEFPSDDALGFPLSKIAAIRAYHFVDDPRSSSAPPVEDDRNSRFPFRNDGSLDPRVDLPEAALTHAEVQQVIRIMHAAGLAYRDGLGPPMHEEGLASSGRKAAHRARLRCGFDPHHVLVLFDVRDRPIGKIFVCFECDEIVTVHRSTAFGGDQPGMMTDEEKATFRKVVGAHGLGRSPQ